MNQKSTILSVILAVLFFAANITYAQDNNSPKWNPDASTRANLTAGNYGQLPVKLNEVPQTQLTRVYHTPSGDVLVPPNVRPLPNSITQSEIDATTMIGNQNVMYAAWNSFGSPSFYGTGFCYTSNGGTTWSGNFQMIVSGNNGDPGPWVYSSTSGFPGRLGISVIGSTMAAFYSTDAGSTWTGYTTMGGSSVDKNLSCVDDVPGSPFLGRAYTIWTDFAGANTNRIVGAYSNNGGVSWTGYQGIAPVPASGHHCQGCDVKVGPGGVVYAIWAYCTTNGQNSNRKQSWFCKINRRRRYMDSSYQYSCCH